MLLSLTTATSSRPPREAMDCQLRLPKLVAVVVQSLPELVETTRLPP